MGKDDEKLAGHNADRRPVTLSDIRDAFDRILGIPDLLPSGLHYGGCPKWLNPTGPIKCRCTEILDEHLAGHS